MVWAADAHAGMFHVLQEKVCRLKRDSPQYFGYMAMVIEKKCCPDFLVLERKCIWWIHLIKAVLADESWRKNKISVSLAKLLLLLLDCFMEDMNLIHFQRQPGNSRQQRKGLPLDLAVFLWIHCSCVKCHQCHLSGHFWGKVSVWELRLSDQGASVPWTSCSVGELAVPAVGTSVKKENLQLPATVDANCVLEKPLSFYQWPKSPCPLHGCLQH